MEKRELKIGDVLQIDPAKNEKWGGFLCVVTEPKSFGAQGYLLHTGDFSAVRANEVAFVRVRFEDVSFIGRLDWLPDFALNREDDE